ncbi:unnamed protein product [Chilo suppressalis]|uniref:Ig-like domain-containing protein n=1 Tax=Chilo suppressalis TaxID=168631 RepID=A0ABN8ATH0_CHISP|nr:unnamed protein product [Chilo suppressalis]
MPIQSDMEPEFLQALENHTVTQGRDVHFTCVVNHLSNYRVAWIKSDSKAILAIHTNMVALNPRLSVTYNNHNTWKLHVSNVQANDSGTYMCQVNTDPMKSQMGYLSVVIPPDIVDTVAEGSTAQEGGSVRLTCTATGEPPPTVMWRREHNRPIVFRHDGGRERRGQSVSYGLGLSQKAAMHRWAASCGWHASRRENHRQLSFGDRTTTSPSCSDTMVAGRGEVGQLVFIYIAEGSTAQEGVSAEECVWLTCTATATGEPTPKCHVAARNAKRT